MPELKSNAGYTTDLQSRADFAQNWLNQFAFPLWAAEGVAEGRGFWECLDLGGEAIKSPHARVRVQARQTYVFSRAQKMGWRPTLSANLARQGLLTITQQCRTKRGLYGFDISLGNGINEDKDSLYDSAFALLAFASCTMTGIDARSEANDLINKLETVMKRPEAQGGYFEQFPTTAVRSQNPHMHLFEAYLMWDQVTNTSHALDRCQEILDFVMETFFCPRINALLELHSTESCATTDNRVEAGHQFEWTWLINTYCQRAKLTSPPLARTLYQAGLELTETDGRIALSHNTQGQRIESDCRLWSLTEALKAHLSFAETGDMTAQSRACATFDRIFKDHMNDVVPGGWRDRLNLHGVPQGNKIPASTGYHIVLAFEELIRVAKLLT